MSPQYRLFGALTLTTTIVACTGHVPMRSIASAFTSSEPGRVAADYPIPSDAPEGALQVASYGVAEIAQATNPSDHLNAIHLRMAIDNRSEKQWWIDTRQQRVEIDGRGGSAPSFASANPGWPPPLVTVPPKTKRVVDMFFALPSDLQHATAIPAFDAIWLLQLEDTVVSDRTPFERLRIQPPPIYSVNDYGVNYYWGPPYYCDEDYSRFGFGGTAALPNRYATHPVIIHRAPNPPRFLEWSSAPAAPAAKARKEREATSLRALPAPLPR